VTGPTWEQWARGENDEVAAAGRRRAVRAFDGRGEVGRLPDGREVVSFASNDYLGLSGHPAVISGARAALDRWGAGAGSARLIVGSRPVHTELESELAAWKNAEAAVLFPNGFAANVGVLQTFGNRDVVICSDELNHASIVDGCRMARARVEVYPHKDMRTLARLLEDNGRTIVVTDTVFSMDGDVAPLDDIAELCARNGSLLVLDEAHAVLGPIPDLDGVEAVRVGTLSKFLGAAGGFAAGRFELIDLLINRARTFIFTTATSPADSGAALAALGLLRSDEGARLIQKLRANVECFSPGNPSPIVPLIVGHERAALEASNRLLELGFLVPAIRPPSVPNGSSRLRVTLSAAHHLAQVTALRTALNDVLAEPAHV
jgi:8-amino-7-oxononanoate synthase